MLIVKRKVKEHSPSILTITLTHLPKLEQRQKQYTHLTTKHNYKKKSIKTGTNMKNKIYD